MLDAGARPRSATRSPPVRSRSTRTTRTSTRRSNAASRTCSATSARSCTRAGRATTSSRPTSASTCLRSPGRVERRRPLADAERSSHVRSSTPPTRCPARPTRGPHSPITVGHHLCAHAWALSRDLGRFADWRVRASVSPLGAGALATSTLGLDPAATAERLGFDRAFENSLDAVSDRDVLQEFVAVARDPRDAPVATGRRPRAMDRPRARLGRARRGLFDRVEHDAPEAEPGHRRARTWQGRADHGRLRHVDRLAPRPAARLPA